MTATMPSRHPALEVAEFEVELVVFDPRVNRVHHLRDLGAAVFDACDGVTPMADLVAEIVEVAGASEQDATEAVQAVLASLTAEGMLEGAEPPAPAPPCLGCGGGAAAVAPARARRWWPRRRQRG